MHAATIHARRVLELERRGDYDGKHAQAIESFSIYTMVWKWDRKTRTHKKLWDTPQRRPVDLRKALEAWATLETQETAS